jgi:hypothetical protein
VTVRNIENKDDLYDLPISYKLAKEIFNTPNATEEELEEVLIVYKLNK